MNACMSKEILANSYSESESFLTELAKQIIQYKFTKQYYFDLTDSANISYQNITTCSLHLYTYAPKYVISF